MQCGDRMDTDNCWVIFSATAGRFAECPHGANQTTAPRKHRPDGGQHRPRDDGDSRRPGPKPRGPCRRTPDHRCSPGPLAPVQPGAPAEPADRHRQATTTDRAVAGTVRCSSGTPGAGPQPAPEPSAGLIGR